MSNKFPTIFGVAWVQTSPPGSLHRLFSEKFNFSNFTPKVIRLFFVEKRKRKIFGFENVMEKGIRKILAFVILLIASIKPNESTFYSQTSYLC